MLSDRAFLGSNAKHGRLRDEVASPDHALPHTNVKHDGLRSKVVPPELVDASLSCPPPLLRMTRSEMAMVLARCESPRLMSKRLSRVPCGKRIRQVGKPMLGFISSNAASRKLERTSSVYRNHASAVVVLGSRITTLRSLHQLHPQGVWEWKFGFSTTSLTGAV